MIYFDNAATTKYKPKAVIDAVNEAIAHSSNANRGAGGKDAGIKIFETRKKIAEFVNCVPTRVIFTGGCTAALNQVIIGASKQKGNVIISGTEHNSVLRPLKEMERKGIISLTVVNPDENGVIKPEKLLSAVKKNTYMAVISHVSNVTGKAQNIDEIGFALSRYGIKFVVDGAQSVGYLPVDMQKSHISALCFPAHKGLHGLQGLGLMCLAEDFSPEPTCFGGTGTDSQNYFQPDYLPERYESGTQNTPAIFALGAAIDWWNDIGKVALPSIARLQAYLTDELSKIDGIRLLSTYNQSGIVAFLVAEADKRDTEKTENFVKNRIFLPQNERKSATLNDKIYRDSNEIGDLLYERGIITRSGLHCAPLTHKYLNTEKTGLTRLSISGENTIEECDFFLNAIREIAAQNE